MNKETIEIKISDNGYLIRKGKKHLVVLDIGSALYYIAEMMRPKEKIIIITGDDDKIREWIVLPWQED